MALNIKDPETEKAVRTLAKRRGVSLTEAVRQAVKKDLKTDEMSEEEKARRIANAQQWLRGFYKTYAVKRPAHSMTKQEMDDIIGYDDSGLL